MRQAETITLITTISRRKEKGHLAVRGSLDELQHIVKQIKSAALCQLHICKHNVLLVSSSLSLSLLLLFSALTTPQADRDLSLDRANQPCQHDHVPPGKAHEAPGRFVVLAASLSRRRGGGW